MMTPARRHLLRMQAQASAEQESLTDASAYELMLAKLATDKRRLKQIQSIERKIEVKLEMLADYQPWISGILTGDSPHQDDVFMTVLLWTLDIGDFPAAYPMAEHAIRHHWVTPDTYKRQTACMIAEEVANTSLKQLNAGVFSALESLQQFALLLASQDMPDEVRARLHKALGIALTESQPQEAMTHLQRALELDEKAGVKKLIEQLERQIRTSVTTG